MIYPAVLIVGARASANFAKTGKEFFPLNNKVSKRTEVSAARITGILRLPSKPKACPVDFARGLLSVYINASLMKTPADNEPI
jgi:hypothetical protein